MEAYKIGLESQDTQQTLQVIRRKIRNQPNTYDIDGAVQSLSEVFNNVCSPLFEVKCKSPSFNGVERKLYDENCERHKQVF